MTSLPSASLAFLAPPRSLAEPLSPLVPQDVVQVAHGVHHQNVDIAGEQEHVLEERGEHVPGLEVHEGADEVETVGSGK